MQAELRTQAAGRAGARPGAHSVAVVLLWELRRIGANRSSAVVAALLFLLFLLLAASQLEAHQLTYYQTGGQNVHLVISGTSVWGMSLTIPRLLLLVFGLVLPFLAADRVTQDWKRRSNEILMATAIPTWAYVAGRYLAALLVSLATAVLLLLAVLALGLAAPLLIGAPPMNGAGVAAIWAVTVLPAAALLSGVSFALSTLAPRQSNLVKVAVLIAWFLCATFVAFQGDPLSAYLVWDPTSAQLSATLDQQYTQQWLAGFQWDAAAQAGSVRAARAVEQQAPELSAWLLPHLTYAGLGLVAVAVAAARFRRFRNI